VNHAVIGRRAWQLYRLLITLIALACVVQIFLAGRGVFGIHGDAPLDDQSSLDPHRALGNAITVAALVTVVLAIVLWDLRLVLWTVVMAVLAGVVQMVTATDEHPWVAGLHPVSGVAILGISASLAARAWRRRGTAEAAA
jgi:hypothetical protein